MEQSGREPCDLVMKGGITSGVVYPGAVIELGKRYSFRNVGGTSAGAIAAGVAAAAEYGRRRSGSDELTGLDEVARELAEPGFVTDLVQPTPGARPAFEAMLRARDRKRSKRRRALRVISALLRHRPLSAAAAGLVWVALAALAIADPPSLPGPGAVVLAVVAAGVLTAVLACTAVGSAAYLVARSLGSALRDNGYGMCTGLRQPGRDELAFTEWLHEKIQACAGLRPEDPPLTFGALEKEEIRLEVMTTDLSLARPVRLPPEDGAYMFSPEDMRGRFPEPIVQHLLRHAGIETEQRGRLELLPGKELPVLVAVRMSLSFPLLISAVRLYSRHPVRSDDMENWFSDGGISSNFPIHFFDSWLPGHPTFGLDLQSFEDERDVPPVYLPLRPDEQPYPHWTQVGSVGRFVKQVLDVMENWRDTMQSELPGFRDRVCQIHLAGDEGRLNLEMDADTIKDLTGRGHEAGIEIGRKFSWRRHLFTRYLTLMQMMERGLQDVDRKFDGLDADLAAGMPGIDVYVEGHEPDWCGEAERASSDLFLLASRWGSPPAKVGFNRGYEPRPTPAMRVTPKA